MDGVGSALKYGRWMWLWCVCAGLNPFCAWSTDQAILLICDKICSLYTQINDGLAHKMNLLHIFNLTFALL
jgi:hypothetical protein